MLRIIKTLLPINYRLCCLLVLLLLPEIVFYAFFLGLPQRVSPKSIWTSFFLLALGGGLIYLFVFKYFGRKSLIAIFLLNLLVSVFLLTFYNAFHHVPSYRVLYQNISEGITVVAAWWNFFPFLFLCCAVFCATGVFFAAKRTSKNISGKILCAAGFVLMGTHFVLAYRVDPAVFVVSNIPNKLTFRHGYFIGQIYDFFWSHSQKMSDMAAVAIRDAESRPVPKLNIFDVGTKENFPDSILLIQTESLDWQAVNLKIQGSEVTPFINTLSRSSAFLKLKANHSGSAGSAGADFQVLTGFRPLKSHNLYLNDAFPWTRSLPRLAAQSGFSFEMIHGNDSDFLHRKQAYTAMGVSNFRDPVSTGKREDTSWGWSDRLLFDEVLKSIDHDRSGRQLKLIITLSSHIPFDFVENQFLQDFSMKGMYLNSINYVDWQVSRFISALKGRHLVVLYGDHESGVLREINSEPTTDEWVPGLVFIANNGKIEKVALSNRPEELLSGNYEIASLYSLVDNFLAVSDSREIRR